VSCVTYVRGWLMTVLQNGCLVSIAFNTNRGTFLAGATAQYWCDLNECTSRRFLVWKSVRWFIIDAYALLFVWWSVWLCVSCLVPRRLRCNGFQRWHVTKRNRLKVMVLLAHLVNLGATVGPQRCHLPLVAYGLSGLVVWYCGLLLSVFCYSLFGWAY